MKIQRGSGTLRPVHDPVQPASLRSAAPLVNWRWPVGTTATVHAEGRTLGAALSTLAKAAMCIAAASQPAFAQDAAAAAPESTAAAPAAAPTAAAAAHERSSTVVTITGTSIRGIAPTGASLKKVGLEDIAISGATTATELLRSVPELGSFNSTGINTGSNQANFVDQPAIHGIGVGNGGGGLTLILLDGHRLPGAGINQTAPDAGVIPQSALERVEVMADGGSSIYGSDAVAGVINFVTRRRFNGAETNVRAGTGDGYRTKNFSQLFGKTWDGGSFLFDYERAENTALNGTSRNYIVNDQTPFGGRDSRSTNCSPANIVMGGARYALTPAGVPVAGASNRCETNRRNDLYPAQHRDQVFASARHAVSDRLNVYGSFLFSGRRMTTQVAGDGVTSGANSVNVPTTSPFYVPIAGVAAGEQSVTYNPLLDFPKGYANRVRTLTSSSVVGANLDLGNDWSAQLEANYGLERDDVREQGFNQALATQAAAAGTFNPYGVGPANSPALLAALGNYETRYYARQTMKQVRVKLDGPLFAVGGGDVRVALGAEGREESFDGLTVNGAADVPPAPYTAGGKRQIKSVFGEVFVPVVGAGNRIPGVYKLDLSLAARYDDYDDVGSTTNPKLGLTWGVVDGAQVRLSAGKSFHAPSLADSGTAIDTRAIRFPCIVGAYIGCDSAQPSDYTVVLAGGNSTLTPETAKTYSLGFELSPALLNGFKASLSYFRVDYNNVITFPTFGPVTDASAAYAGYRTLRPAGASNAAWMGQVSGLLTGFRHDGAVYPDVANLPTAVYDLRRQNFADERINGVDYSVGYLLNTGYGKVSFDLTGTRLLKYVQMIPGVADVNERLGTNYAIRNKARGQLGFAAGDVTANLFVNYTDGYRNARVSPAQQVASFTTVDTNLAWNLNGAGMLKGTRLSLNVSNLLDRNPPLYFTGGENGLIGFDPSASSALGRVVSLALNKRW